MSAFSLCTRHSAGAFNAAAAGSGVGNILFAPVCQLRSNQPVVFPATVSAPQARVFRTLYEPKYTNYFLSAQPCYKVNSPLTGRAMSSWR